MHTGRAIELLIDVELPDNSFDDPFLVIGVENYKVRRDRQILSLPAQNTGAYGVERAQHNPFRCLLGQKALDAFRHFLGGFVGKGDGQDLPGSHALDRDEVGDTLGEHPRLTGPRAGHHQDRSVASRDGFHLLFVEFIEKFHKRK